MINSSKKPVKEKCESAKKTCKKYIGTLRLKLKGGLRFKVELREVCDGR